LASGCPYGFGVGWEYGLGSGGFFGFFVIFYAGFVGVVIARIVHRIIGRRRGRWMPHLVASAVVVGGLLPALLVFFFGGQGFSFQLIFLGLYVVIAASAAFYQMK
jgi:hypothetical protein